MKALVGLAERGLLPDAAVRHGIRRLLARHLEHAACARGEARAEFLARLRAGPIAIETDAANRQHYELPPGFFSLMLGRRMKYSSGYWPAGVDDLDGAEEAMLELGAARAGLADGMEVLDLGCGWGAATLWIAERFRSGRVLGVTNSTPQRDHVRKLAARRGLRNVEVLCADVNTFDPGRRLDRVVSIEMFEHLRNPERLLARIAGWLAPGGRLFVHVFSHRELAYFFETGKGEDWMARNFFSGGMMPSHDLLPGLRSDLVHVGSWRMNGTHYARTLEAWLARLDASRPAARAALARSAGDRGGGRELQRWRMFLMACAELFAYRRGSEWGVSHHLFAR